MKTRKLSNGKEMTTVEFGEIPDDVRDEFEAMVEAYELAEPVRLLDVLAEGGYPVAPPDTLTDAELPEALMRIVEGLSLLRVYLESTDHLSNRELYDHLWNESLIEPTVIFPKNPCGALHLDLVGSGSDEDTDIYLRYYADEETRLRWGKEFKVDLPPREKPPYDRDGRLPKRRWDFEESMEN